MFDFVTYTQNIQNRIHLILQPHDNLLWPPFKVDKLTYNLISLTAIFQIIVLFFYLETLNNFWSKNRWLKVLCVWPYLNW